MLWAWDHLTSKATSNSFIFTLTYPDIPHAPRFHNFLCESHRNHFKAIATKCEDGCSHKVHDIPLSLHIGRKAPNSKGHSKTLSCAQRGGRIQTSISPWEADSTHASSISPGPWPLVLSQCPCVLLTAATLYSSPIYAHLFFLKQHEAPCHQRPMGVSGGGSHTTVDKTWLRSPLVTFQRKGVLSVLGNNIQNFYIPVSS